MPGLDRELLKDYLRKTLQAKDQQYNKSVEEAKISLLQAEVEILEGMKKKIDYSYQNVPEEWRADPDNVEAYGYNQALQDQISHLQEEIKE